MKKSRTPVSRGPACDTIGEPYRVLLVEDNPVNQRLMRRVLENMHCRADIAANGREALAILRTGRYELVFMDCNMPVMDGYEATAEIRKTQPSERLPIIAVTASVLKADHDRCRQVGMDQIITKPVDPDEIRAALVRWCRRTPVPTPGRNPAQDHPPSASP